MTIISGPNIQAYNLVSPFEPSNLRRSSYDLSVGSQYYICDHENIKSSVIKAEELEPNQSMEIPPNAVCYILSKEKIILPDNITARISLRMTCIYNGLMLAVQPPFDPGYDGYVVAMLYNLSNSPVSLKEGDRVLTIEFSELDHPVSKNTNQLPKSSNVLKLDQALKKRFRSSMDSLQAELTSIKKDLKDKLDIYHKVVTLIVPIVAIFTGVLMFRAVDKQDDQLAEQKQHIKILEAKQTQLEISLAVANEIIKRVESNENIKQAATTFSPNQITTKSKNFKKNAAK